MFEYNGYLHVFPQVIVALYSDNVNTCFLLASILHNYQAIYTLCSPSLSYT